MQTSRTLERTNQLLEQVKNTEISNDDFSNHMQISPFTVNLNDANTENTANNVHQMNSKISMIIFQIMCKSRLLL